MRRLGVLYRWEGLLLVILLATVATNAAMSPFFLTVGNQINLFQLSIEKIIVALIMTLVIVSGEIDLSVASMMGLAACAFGWLYQEGGVPAWAAVPIVLGIGAAGGAWNAFWIACAGIPSLVVTLAMLIGFRGAARILVEDRGIGGFPDWFDALGQQPVLGPFPLALLIFLGLFVVLAVVLHFAGFGRKVYVIGNSREVAEYSGVDVVRVKTVLFVASGTVAALAGLLYAARVSSVRGDVGLGFELDIITMVLLGGVSIFGGSGTIWGTLLAVLIVLNIRNGMALADITGHVQTGVIGLLLIVSVLIPNARGWLAARLGKRAA